MSVKFYRKKPVVIEAVQWLGNSKNEENVQELLDFMQIEELVLTVRNGITYILIETLEGTMEGKPGCYVIKGVKGEFYPCDKEIFEQTYEEVE